MVLLSNSGGTVKSIRSHLIMLVLVAVLPILLFAGGLVGYLSLEQKKVLHNNLNGTARAIGASINEQITAVISSLQVLVYTEDFNDEKPAVLYRKLKHVTENIENWDSVSVIDLEGKQLFNTSVPFGSPLKSQKDEEFFKQVIKSKQPVISNFRSDELPDSKVITVAIPVLKYGDINRILTASVSLKSLSLLLKQQGIPSEWNATLIDSNFIILARSNNPDKYIGQPAPILQSLSKANKHGVYELQNREGIPTYGVYHPSELTGWIISLSIPADSMIVLSGVLKLTLLVALFFIVMGIVLAMYMGRKIANPIIALSHSAEEFGKGIPTTFVKSSVEEIQILSNSMNIGGLERIRSEKTFKTLYEISSSLAGELELKALLQSFIDQTTELTRAEFGAYFENTEFPEFITRSGKERSNTSYYVFPYAIEKVDRVDDLMKDSRYEIKTPVRSFLSIPVISRNGEVLGGIIFGHSKPNMFSEKDEKIMIALVAHAASAIDNAGLYLEATQAIELRDTFLSVASHELKTPLTSIYLQFEILKRHTLKTAGDDPKIITIFNRFQSQLERLTRLIDELLDVSRIASGKMSLHPEKVELEKLVSEICGNFEIEALQKNSPITVHTKQSVTGEWDVNRIEQVVANLVSNAIKYGNKKPINVYVTKNEKWAIIRIQDQGMGIAPVDQARIFQRFERAIDSFSISGLGLGLFICKEIMLRHGGDIIVESKLNEGSTFTLRLPLT